MESEVIYWVMGPRVGNKVESDLFRSGVQKKGDPDAFTYRGLDIYPNTIFNRSKPSSNWRTEDTYTFLNSTNTLQRSTIHITHMMQKEENKEGEDIL